ncbi:MAG: RagB/SusD family nutrient uptake outer membrane protein [Chitinophagaceae bacterium]|nr:RagB/SusD family nutrient uptake outer membrane protein [Chitinophagaceae bacterium]
MYKKIIYILIISVTLFSCKKLTETPLSFVEPTSFYQTKTQIEAAYAAAMNSVWSGWSGYQYPGIQYFNHDDQMGGGNLVIPNNFSADLWRRHYEAILNLNMAIAGMKNGNLGTSVDATTYNQLMGQALFLRGWNYFCLVRLWGDLPLVLDDTEDPIANPPSRTSVKDVYVAIVTDLTTAVANLPAEWNDGSVTKPTRDAAKGMLAKVYLTMATAPLNETENYARAASLAKEVIDANTYTLIHDIDKVFTLDTRYGPEVMFTFTANYADGTMSPQVWTPPVLNGWGDFSVQPQWAEVYPETPRKDAYILHTLNGVKYTNWPGTSTPYIKKYMYDKPDDYAAYRSIVTLPVLRLADVYLIFAEADNMANGAPTQAAVDAVNKIIERANGYTTNANHPLATIGMSKDAFDALVIEERNQELCFETGDRWYDLCRKRILGEKTIEFYRQNFSDDDYLYPIPDNDIRLNQNLNQNKGYSLP